MGFGTFDTCENIGGILQGILRKWRACKNLQAKKPSKVWRILNPVGFGFIKLLF